VIAQLVEIVPTYKPYRTEVTGLRAEFLN